MRAKQSANAIRPSQKGGHGQAQDKGEEGRGGRDIFYYRVGHDHHRPATGEPPPSPPTGMPCLLNLQLRPYHLASTFGSRLQAGRQVKGLGGWQAAQVGAEGANKRREQVCHRAPHPPGQWCKRLEAKKITGSAVERMSGAYDLLNPEGRVGCGQEIPFGDRSCA